MFGVQVSGVMSRLSIVESGKWVLGTRLCCSLGGSGFMTLNTNTAFFLSFFGAGD